MQGKDLDYNRCDDFWFNDLNLVAAPTGSVLGLQYVYTLDLPGEIVALDKGAVYISMDNWAFGINTTAFTNGGLLYVCCAEVHNDPVTLLPILQYAPITAPAAFEIFGSESPNPLFYQIRELNNIGGSSTGVKQLHFFFMVKAGGGTTYINVPYLNYFGSQIRISRSSYDEQKYYIRPGRLRGEKRLRNNK